MRLSGYLLIVTVVFSFAFSCDDDEIQEALEDERTNALVTFQHFGDAGGCSGTNDPITFVVSYREVQAFVDLDVGGTGFLNLSVVDEESVNVQVRKQEDSDILADANVTVRTSSRPESLDEEARVVTYCSNFSLIFSNF